MEGYIKITSQADLEKMIYAAMGFHDALLKEISILSRGFQSNDGLYGDVAPYDMRFFYQSHWEKEKFFGIELIFKNVTKFIFEPCFSSEVSGKFKEQYKVPKTGSLVKQSIVLSFGGTESLTCEHIFYRLLNENELGRGPFTIKQIELEDEERYGQE